jgi:hypothetical protein
MKAVFFLLLLLTTTNSFSQVTDQFTDGDFTSNPTWNGTTSVYIVNASQQLQLNNSVAATSYLSLAHSLSTLDGKEWNFWYSQTFAPSSSNYGRFYLTSSSADLTTNPDGFYLQFGEAGSLDAVRLFKCVSGVSTQICAGPDGQIAASFAVGIRVTRDNSGNWKLFVDPAGGTNYGSPYSGTDASNLLGTHSGVLAVYTVSNATKFYLDNLYIGDEIFDLVPPALTSATAIDATHVDVLFNEPVAGSAILQASNYSLNPSDPVIAVSQDGTNLALLHLTLTNPMTNGQTYQLTVTSFEDAAGNTSGPQNTNFQYLVGETAVKGDIIINEFFADPTPVIGLPELEFVELYNRSNKYIDLSGWKLGDASGDGTVSGGFIGPNEYKILCATSSVTEYPGSIAVSSFPSLNNSGDDIVLKSNDLTLIDKVSYTDDWYRDEIKQDGGFTLELINPLDPCSDASNWIASNATNGGTPGVQNSVYDITPDTQVPTLVSVNAFAPNIVEVTFSEGMDSASVANSVITTVASLTVNQLVIPTEYSKTATVTFNENIAASQLYTITISNVADCWLNTTNVNGEFALAELPVPGDLVLNELLFDPATGGSDFVELYNTSQKVIDLKEMVIANFEDDSISNPHPVLNNYFLFPGNYVVLTPDSVYQKNTFSSYQTGTFYQMTLPAMNNDSGSVFLMLGEEIIDKVSYFEDWHFSLVDETENKTLERINPFGESDSRDNWHTAAETVGFGTPGRQNSQYQVVVQNGDFATNEPVFSPDNDGYQDVMLFNYQLSEPGFLATVVIYDDQGREVKTLFKNELMDVKGTFSWNGLNDEEIKAGLGVYLAVIEAFDIDGTQKFVKRIAFTLAGKLN